MLEYWSPGVLEYWNTEILEYWNTGILEYWNNGILNTGILESWNNEQIFRSCFLNSRLYLVPDFAWPLDEQCIIWNLEKQEMNISSVFQYSSISVL